MVLSEKGLKLCVTKRRTKELFPTPESPIITSLISLGRAAIFFQRNTIARGMEEKKRGLEKKEEGLTQVGRVRFDSKV